MQRLVKYLVVLSMGFVTFIHGLDIIQLPEYRWAEYKELRLKAVAQEPISFAMLESDLATKPEEFWKKNLADAAAQDGRWLLFAQEDGHLVGMAGAVAEWADYSLSSHTVTISNVYVAPEFRGQGIATKLMHELLAQLKNDPTLTHLLLWVAAHQTQAISLYERQGFTVVGEVTRCVKFQNRYYGMLLMEKALSD